MLASAVLDQMLGIKKARYENTSASLFIMQGDEVLMTCFVNACDWTKQRGMLACCVIESQYLANGEKKEKKMCS